MVLRWLPVAMNKALDGEQPGEGDSPIRAVLRSKVCWLPQCALPCSRCCVRCPRSRLLLPSITLQLSFASGLHVDEQLARDGLLLEPRWAALRDP